MEFLRQVFKSFNVEKDLSAEDAVAGPDWNTDKIYLEQRDRILKN